MKRTWEQEKAYRERRANMAMAEMDAAIETVDKVRFLAAWDAAMRYMNKKQRSPYYIRMLQAAKEKREREGTLCAYTEA